MKPTYPLIMNIFYKNYADSLNYIEIALANAIIYKLNANFFRPTKINHEEISKLSGMSVAEYYRVRPKLLEKCKLIRFEDGHFSICTSAHSPIGSRYSTTENRNSTIENEYSTIENKNSTIENEYSTIENKNSTIENEYAYRSLLNLELRGFKHLNNKHLNNLNSLNALDMVFRNMSLLKEDREKLEQLFFFLEEKQPGWMPVYRCEEKIRKLIHISSGISLGELKRIAERAEHGCLNSSYFYSRFISEIKDYIERQIKSKSMSKKLAIN